MSSALITSFLKSFFEEYVSGLENVQDGAFSGPLTLKDLTLKVDRINEEIDDVGTCPFSLTDGKIGTLSLKPGWLGGLTICASAVELNLSFSAMKAMQGAMGGNGEDPEEDYQNQVPWDVQQGMTNGYPPQPQLVNIPKNTAVFCSDHDESEKRPKVEPQTRPCQHCKTDLTTNYQDFALCPNCSGNLHKCMICGKAASSSGAICPPAGAGSGAPNGQMKNGMPNGGPPPPPPQQNRAPPGPPVRHHGTTCDNCGDRDFAGVRYRCLYCPDYDLCEKCYQRRSAFHPPNHTFETLARPKGSPDTAASRPPPYGQPTPRAGHPPGPTTRDIDLGQPPGPGPPGQKNPLPRATPANQLPRQPSNPNKGPPDQENRPPWQQPPSPQQNGMSPPSGIPGFSPPAGLSQPPGLSPAPGLRAPASTPNGPRQNFGPGGRGAGITPPQGITPMNSSGYPRNNPRQGPGGGKPGSWNWLFGSCQAVDGDPPGGEIRTQQRFS